MNARIRSGLRKWRFRTGWGLALSLALAVPMPAQDNNPPPAETEPLSIDKMKALVIITGDYSAGTGFVAKMHGRFFIVTNEHVLSGNKKFTLAGVDGTKYPTNGTLFGAKDYDVAILQIPDGLAKYYLEIDSDPQADTKVGQLVTVPGNADGTGVPAQINGQLVGIGPDKVEVTAKFVHGNSGSPIIYRANSKVIGIATEVMMTAPDDVKKAANAPESHWLGYRIDNIPQDTGWIKLDWSRFSDEGVELAQLEESCRFLYAMAFDDKILLTDNPQMKAAVDIYHTRINQAKRDGNEKDALQATIGLETRAQSVVNEKIHSLASRNLYPFHANQIKEIQDLIKVADTYVQQDIKTMTAHLEAMP